MTVVGAALTNRFSSRVAAIAVAALGIAVLVASTTASAYSSGSPTSVRATCNLGAKTVTVTWSTSGGKPTTVKIYNDDPPAVVYAERRLTHAEIVAGSAIISTPTIVSGNLVAARAINRLGSATSTSYAGYSPCF